MQIDEDTDRDRYMSPLEAKEYGLIDHVIGGDDAGFKVRLLVPSQHCAHYLNTAWLDCIILKDGKCYFLKMASTVFKLMKPA